VPAAKSRNDGNGLRNMRERMAQIGGACDVRSEPGAGTTVTFTLQLN
jgi:signal transduction histidine kinase